LAVRRRIAERIATPLKRAGLETPVLEQIPHKAEQLTAFYYQAVEASGGRQVAELLKIPAFAHGKAYGEIAGFWYRVTFSKPIMNPSVVAVAEGRRGAIPKVKAPTISIPTVELPKIRDISIPDITIPDFEIPRLPTAVGRFECGWAISRLTDGLNDLMVVVETMLARINEIIDKVSGVVKETRDTIKATHDKLKENILATQESLKESRNNTQTAINKYGEYIESSVNEGLSQIIPILYQIWGLPSDMVISPVSIRNVTSTGFEFQSLGKFTVHWICVGQRV